jgi:hypothetical protein
VGGESLKGPSQRAAAALAFTAVVCASLPSLPPSPLYWAVLASGSHKGQDFSATPGSAPSSRWLFCRCLSSPHHWGMVLAGAVTRCGWGVVGVRTCGAGSLGSCLVLAFPRGHLSEGDASGALVLLQRTPVLIGLSQGVYFEAPEPWRHPLFSGARREPLQILGACPVRAGQLDSLPG